MADIREENNVFGGVEFNNENGNNVQEQASNGKNLPVKQGFWTKFKSFWFQEALPHPRKQPAPAHCCCRIHIKRFARHPLFRH